ncbi:hypothetical protein [Dokdonella immobilis]|uniref:hypothetical protein n=1 Tax=Dokdonella immobilis TaxID=578942 RepID=UPI0011143B10|nr:hypothetical protein [Dokdonella immobilis]
MGEKDRLLAQAWLTVFSSPRDALEKWKALATLEPDLFQAQGAYAYYLWIHANDFRAAIEADKRNAVPQNPNAGTGHYLLGTLFLGMERYQDAQREFAEAKRIGTVFQNEYVAASFAAQRDYARIAELKSSARPSVTPGQKVSAHLTNLALALDQGKWKDHALEMRAAEKTIGELDPINARVMDNAVLASKLLVATSEQRAQLLASVPTVALDAAAGVDDDVASLDASLLFRAWLATRFGDDVLAARLSSRVSERVRAGDYPALGKLLDLVNASIGARNGHLDESIRNLRAGFDGNELYASHALLMRLLADKGDLRAAREQARWLASHRGRAYTEVAAGEMFIPLNVHSSNLAKLREAEYSIRLRESADARKSLAELRRFWPEDSMPAELAAELRRLDGQIESESKASGGH